MTNVRVQVHDAALPQLLREHGVRADMNRRADNVLAQARGTADVDTGEYRSKLHVQRTTGPQGVEVLTVTAGTDHDIYVEAQDGTLVKALDAAAR